MLKPKTTFCLNAGADLRVKNWILVFKFVSFFNSSRKKRTNKTENEKTTNILIYRFKIYVRL